MFGGFTYENKKIQEAIDQTFIAQQEKVNAKAMLDAQADKNTRINSEAEALSKAAETQARGVANGNLLKFEAEAKGLLAVNDAIAKANNNPIIVELKRIEVEKIKADKWNGTYPATVCGEGANLWVGLSQDNSKNIPASLMK